MTRRLPIYLLLDTSGSMSGTAINAVNQGLLTFKDAMFSDPRVMETAFVSIITFDSTANVAVPLTDVVSFSPPKLTAQGSTALGQALKLVGERINGEVQATSSAEQKGDYKPLIFVFTDGQPTDDWRPAAANLKKRNCTIIGCVAGEQADELLMKDFCGQVVKLSDTDAKGIKGFFNWVTDSVKLASASAASGAGQVGFVTPPPNPNSGLLVVP